MAEKSFIEILEREIRDRLRAELRSELRAELAAELGGGLRAEQQAAEGFLHNAVFPAPSEILDAWLTGRVDKTTFANRKAYSAYRPRVAAHAGDGASQKPPPPPSSRSSADAIAVSPTTPQHIDARDLISRHSGSALGARFTRSQLKKAWRKAALRSHPDRYAQADSKTQARMRALFVSLSAAYETLDNLFAAQ